MKDDYIHLFVRRPVRRSPIVNCGHYAHWAALRKTLLQFLSYGKSTDDNCVKEQILSLGAGFDKTYFQLQVPEVPCNKFCDMHFCAFRYVLGLQMLDCSMISWFHFIYRGIGF